MIIDKYKQPDGWYIDEDGVNYQSAVSFLAQRFDFCGCGDNEAALNYIRQALVLAASLREMEYDAWSKHRDALFGSEGAMYFMWYFLDSHELTEHGSSVPGWLTEKGKEMLSDLTELFVDGQLD